MRAAIISAMEIEIAFVAELLGTRTGWKKGGASEYINEEKKLSVVTKVLGVGKVNAAYQTADLIWEYHPDLIINVGFAGGLAAQAKTGDLAIGSSYVQEDLHVYLEENRKPIADTPRELVESLLTEAERLNLTAYAGKIATGDYFLNSTEDKNRILAEHAPVAFDMESAAIAQVATAKKIPFVSIRTFSDLADDNALETALAASKENRIPIEQRPIVLAIETIEQELQNKPQWKLA